MTGDWQFSESVDYLRHIGALDETDPKRMNVVIPNYIQSQSNCIAGSSFYSVCCFDECEGLLGHVEREVRAPSAYPPQIIAVVSNLQSDTVHAPRNLSKALLSRLGEIARHHGGSVPLHGRLFAQWMHHAYPRECPYPHLSGTVRAQKPLDFTMATQTSPVHTKEEMSSIVDKYRAEQASSELDLGDECTVWNTHEE